MKKNEFGIGEGSTKFRWWDSKNKEMLHFPLSSEGDQFALVFLDGKLRMFGLNSGETYEGTLIRFTGVMDRDKKEGYEGDIVEVSENNNYIIEFRYGEFRLYSVNARNEGKEYSIAIMVHLPGSKIIGNVFSNPNLIKE